MSQTLEALENLFRSLLRHRYTAAEITQLFTIFAGKTTGLSQPELRQNRTLQLTAAQNEILMTAAEALETGKPFQQILGECEFFGEKFFVDENVLIPRPETEELLELAFEKITSYLHSAEFSMLDIGTGSGIIPIMMKKKFPHATVCALDVSAQALAVARRNAQHHGVDIKFLQSDYLREPLSQSYDVIISNPPYIAAEESEDISDTVKNHEPEIALFAPQGDALAFYKKLAQDCRSSLNSGGMVFLEINQKLGCETLSLFRDVCSEVQLTRDISGNDRFVWGKK